MYIELGWAKRMHGRVRLQNIAANNILQYMKEKYGDFEYSQATVMTTLDEENESTYFGTDNQWCVFMEQCFAIIITLIVCGWVTIVIQMKY